MSVYFCFIEKITQKANTFAKLAMKTLDYCPACCTERVQI